MEIIIFLKYILIVFLLSLIFEDSFISNCKCKVFNILKLKIIFFLDWMDYFDCLIIVEFLVSLL